MAASSQDEPILMIAMDGDGYWSMTKEAKECLQQINKPVASLAIIGKYRSGKSFLMNLLCDSRTKFRLGHGTEAQTKGIWMLPMDHPEVPDTCLLLLDTEGLDDVCAENYEKDKKIFSLIVLLSSTLILNVEKVLSKGSFRNLHLASAVAEILQMDTQSENNEIAKFCPPHLSVVIRDYQSDDKVSPAQYLEKVLSGRGKIPECDFINKHFTERSCYSLPSPTETAHLTKLGDHCVSLSTDFEKCWQNVKGQILKETSPFTLNATAIQGEEYDQLCDLYIKSINIEDLDLPSEAEILRQKMLKERYFKEYLEMMEDRIDQSLPHEEKLRRMHEECKSVVLDKFKKHRLQDKVVSEFTDQLEAYFKTKVQTIREESEKRSNDALAECFTELNDKFTREEYFSLFGIITFYWDKCNAEILYMKKSRLGPAKCELLKNEQRKLEKKAGEVFSDSLWGGKFTGIQSIPVLPVKLAWTCGTQAIASIVYKLRRPPYDTNSDSD